ncbi:hypothetical protein BSFA1_54250 [Burkholderia sp. SFA1]|nr:hypothetical protein [Caballeronia sp. CLC5]MCE4574909.1 hypothetical protein [Caballeronia sp. CLC5]BBQ00297.1 hypothetical protein BSFA1_54250 [Burkholderia sp. SFA1]
MYRAAFVTPEMLLIEYSVSMSPLLVKLRQPDALSLVRRLASVLCGLR